jgi:hypothetical protein
MRNERNFDRSPTEPGQDPRRDLANKLFNPLVHEYGQEAVLKFISDQTHGIASNVVLEWLNGMRHPSQGIRTQILSCLKNFRPGDISKPEKISQSPLPADKPKTAARLVAKNKPTPPKQKGEGITAEEERQYEVLKRKLIDGGKIKTDL